MSHQARRRTALAVLLAAGFLLGACGDDSGTTASSDSTATTAAGDGVTTTTGQEHGCAVAEGGQVTIVAKNLGWDVPCIQAPEGNKLTITEDNQDKDVNHNIHITGLPGSPKTELATGPGKQSLDLPAGIAAGEYAYTCDIHPNMTGTLEMLAPLAEG